MPTVRVSQMMIGAVAAPAGGAFIFTVATTGADETFTLPLEAAGSYAFSVDWGDSGSDNINAWDAAAKTHTYASAGTYEISITGTLYGFRFNNTGDKTKIYELKSWGAVRLGNSDGYFQGCSNLTITATDILDLTGTTTFKDIFYNCSSLITVPSMNNWNVSTITSMYAAFYNAPLFNQNISSWNVSSVTTMAMMFSNASAFNQNIGGWNISNVDSAYDMFSYTSAFNQDIGSWDVSSLTALNAMFYDASAFNQDISGWDVSNITNVYTMFQGAVSFDQDLSAWNVTSMTNMGYMFNGVTLSTANYDAILIGFEGQAVNNNVPFHGGNSKYSAGTAATARAALMSDHVWEIFDGGQV